MTNLALESTGLVCAVGRSAPLACAAIRAGTSRRAPLPGQTVLSVDGEGEPAVGHAVAIVTGGYFLFARWRRLARAALLDLRSRLDANADAPAAWAKTLLVLVLPAPADRSLFDEPRTDAEWMATWAQPLVRSAGLALPERSVVLHIGADPAAALAALPRWLGERGCDRAVVVAADSCIEEGATRLFAEAGRLWSPERPVGLSPGEAGVALLLSTTRNPAGLELAGTATAKVDVRDDTERGLAGNRLAECARAALSSTPPAPTMQWIADLNGEVWRANQIGHAQVALAGAGIRLPGFETPASSTGDTGVAQLFLGIALAKHLHDRAGRGPFLITASGHGGQLAACVLRRADAARR